MHNTGPCPAIIDAPRPAQWPLWSHLALAALPSAVPCARGHVRAVALEWGLAHLADTAELLASELVTNSVQVSRILRTTATPIVRITVGSDRETLAIRVWDGSEVMPVPRKLGPAMTAAAA
jgi:hypothetical protein